MSRDFIKKNVCHHCCIERSVSANSTARRKHWATTPLHHVIWSVHAQMLNCCRMHSARMLRALRLLSVNDILFSAHAHAMLHYLNDTSHWSTIFLFVFSLFLGYNIKVWRVFIQQVFSARKKIIQISNILHYKWINNEKCYWLKLRKLTISST